MTSFDMSVLVERPFEPETISALEVYVKSQAGSGSYDWAANKGLMKAYSCMGVSIDADVNMIATLLALSMMRLPSTDFLQLSYLLPSKFAADPKVAVLIKCADMLERAQFRGFWNEIKGEEIAPLVSGINNFEDCIRTFMLGVVSKTFKNIAKPTLLGNLGLSDNNADEFLKSSSFIVASSVGGSMIEFVEQKSDDSQSAGKKQNEIVVKAGELSKAMSAT